MKLQLPWFPAGLLPADDKAEFRHYASSEPLMARLRVLIAIVVSIKRDLAEQAACDQLWA